MPYAVIREFPTLSADDFDRLQAEIGDEEPDGLIVHAAGPIGRGWQTIDVFETRAAFEAYERERLAPALSRVGLCGHGSSSAVAVHRLLHPAIPALYRAASAGTEPADSNRPTEVEK